MGVLIIANNKRARFDYEIIEKYEAGIVLTGAEVKSIRSRNVSINEAFVIFKKNEAFIFNMNVKKYEFSTNKFSVSEPTRTRKLLLHRKEINKLLMRVKKENLTVVPLSLYFSRGNVKIEIILGKGRKNYDKRSLIKERDEERKLNKLKF